MGAFHRRHHLPVSAPVARLQQAMRSGCTVHNKPDGLALAIASETELLREFTQVDDHEWQSIQELQPEAFDLAVPKNLGV